MDIYKSKYTGEEIDRLLDIVEEGGSGITSILYEDLVNLRNNAQLEPGRLYRITDYITTVNTHLINNAQSAGHAFDLIVIAESETVLHEQAFAIQHNGDTYFQNNRLEAWEVKYRLDNVQWSMQAGTYCTSENDGYNFYNLGTIELSGTVYQLWKGDDTYIADWADYAISLDTEVGTTLYAYYGNPEDFNPENLDEVDTIGIVEVEMNNGKGTIISIKDEFGNECPYDFKNIQFKRYMTTDSVNGREGLGGLYMVADPNNTPIGLSVDDESDFIWAFTFSSDNSGGIQTDYSLGDYDVHDNVFGGMSNGSLNNNVMYGDGNYNNQIGDGCYSNSWGNNNTDNSWGNYNSNNSWGNTNGSNSWGNNNGSNSWGNNNFNNSWGNNNDRNTWGNVNSANSWGNNNSNNSWGNNNSNNSWGNYNSNNSCGNYNVVNSLGDYNYNNSYFDSIEYTEITTDGVKNVQVLSGVTGTTSSKIILGFTANVDYTQVACLNSSNNLVIYVPGDLA